MRNKPNVYSLEGSSIKQMVWETLGEMLEKTKIIINYHPILNISVNINTCQLSVQESNTFLVINNK